MFSSIITNQLEFSFSTEKIELVGIQIFDQSLNIIAKFCKEYYYDELIIDNIMFCCNSDENDTMIKLADIFCEYQCVKKIKICSLDARDQHYTNFIVRTLAAEFIENITLICDTIMNNDIVYAIKNNKKIKQVNIFSHQNNQIEEIILANYNIDNINFTHNYFVKKNCGIRL